MEKSKISHVIIFWDNSKKFINPETNGLMENLVTSGFSGFEVDGNKFKFADIQKWITLEEFRSLYPSETEEKLPPVKLPPWKPITREKRIKGLEMMIVGFKKFFEKKEMSTVSKKILKKMEIALQSAKESKEKFMENPIKEFYK